MEFIKDLLIIDYENTEELNEYKEEMIEKAILYAENNYSIEDVEKIKKGFELIENSPFLKLFINLDFNLVKAKQQNLSPIEYIEMKKKEKNNG